MFRLGAANDRGLCRILNHAERYRSRGRDQPGGSAGLTAYRAGAGETAGWLHDAVAEQGLPLPSCTRRLSLDDKSARQALQASAPGPAAETAATPLIVRDMLKRAGCRLADR
ncbi:hypothetical protein LJR220_007092 [Bradyrhizobium sp. LjRoot220]|uniref:hypothetical protein n=1 Tax=Bradyrhizobium sp. LjRoot220 TaxID=3342284 RepID=UPI003ED16AAC